MKDVFENSTVIYTNVNYNTFNLQLTNSENGRSSWTSWRASGGYRLHLPNPTSKIAFSTIFKGSHISFITTSPFQDAK